MTVKARRGGKRVGSGRKPGVKNKATIDLKKVAEPYSKEAVEVLVSIMRDKEVPAATRVQAADKLLDRGHGKPAIAIGIDAEIDVKETSLDHLKKFLDVMEKSRERQRLLSIERGLEIDGEYKEEK